MSRSCSYNGFLSVDLASEHEPTPSSRQTAAQAVFTFNHLDKRDKPYIDGFLITVVHVHQGSTSLTWLGQCANLVDCSGAAPVFDKNESWGWKTEQSTLEHSTVRCRREKSNFKACRTKIELHTGDLKPSHRLSKIDADTGAALMFWRVPAGRFEPY